MRKPFRWDKKYLYWGITAFLVIAASILFYMALNYLPMLRSGVASLIRIFSPFIWGLVISYLISPIMRFLEDNIFMPLGSRLYRKSRTNDGSGFARVLSVLFSEIILIVMLVGLVYLIIPQLYQSIETIASSMPSYIARTSAFLNRTFEDYPALLSYISSILGNLNDLTTWLQSTVFGAVSSIVTNLTSGVYGALKAVYNVVVGIIVSVYILSDKEHFAANFKRVLYSVFTPEAVQRMLVSLDFVDNTFMRFISGKLLDSAIIGIICYIGCAIMRMPYALLVSVIIGITNIIPFFGPFIGAVPCTLIILLSDPLKGLIFVVFVLVLQQVDGNFIGPKILGNTVGVSGFWIMFSIIIGAGLFGFWGMLLGVPVFVCIYTFVNKSIERKLRRSDLPWEAEDYTDIDYIDPVTRQPVRGSKNFYDDEDDE